MSNALPDGWGRLLMNRRFRQRGINGATASPLDRLAFIGDGAMGALTLEPASEDHLGDQDVELVRLEACEAFSPALVGKCCVISHR